MLCTYTYMRATRLFLRGGFVPLLFVLCTVQHWHLLCLLLLLLVCRARAAAAADVCVVVGSCRGGLSREGAAARPPAPACLRAAQWVLGCKPTCMQAPPPFTLHRQVGCPPCFCSRPLQDPRTCSSACFLARMPGFFPHARTHIYISGIRIDGCSDSVAVVLMQRARALIRTADSGVEPRQGSQGCCPAHATRSGSVISIAQEGRWIRGCQPAVAYRTSTFLRW